MFLWKPIFRGDALLPGDYLTQMAPWNGVFKPANDNLQWNPLQWDAIAQYYPWRVFYARLMRSGHLPLWNPHQFCGTYFLANGQSAVLYPLNLLFLIFDPITACTVFAALHLFMAQVFMYWLMRRLGRSEVGGIVGAVCFAFSAFMVLWLELPTFVSVAVWLPLILLLILMSVERRSVAYAMYAGACMAISVFGGHLQIAMYVGLAAMFWWVWLLIGQWRSEGFLKAKSILACCAVFVVIAGMISAAQVLPSMELGRISHRSGGPSADGYAWFTANALQPYRLITAFAPDFFGNPSNNDYYLLGMFGRHAGSAADYMEYGMYIGIMPLMLAGLGLFGVKKQKYSGYFAALSMIAMLSALGTIVNLPFYYLIPGVSAFGGPNRILLLYLFGIAGLAGFGIDKYMQMDVAETIRLLGKQRLKTRVQLWVSWFLASMILILSLKLGLSLLEELSRPRPTGSGDPVIAHGLFVASLLFLGCYPVFFSKRTISCIVVLYIIADLFAFGINYNPTCSRDKVYPKTPLTEALIKLGPNTRIAPINNGWSLWQNPKSILPPNAAMVYGLYDAQGYDSLFTRHYKDLSSRVQGGDSSPVECGNMVIFKRYKKDMNELANVFLSREPIDAPELKQVGVYDGVRVYQGPSKITNLSFMPRLSSAYRDGLDLSCMGIAIVCFGWAASLGRGKVGAKNEN